MIKFLAFLSLISLTFGGPLEDKWIATSKPDVGVDPGERTKLDTAEIDQSIFDESRQKGKKGKRKCPEGDQMMDGE
jgi:hypothetical protein